MLFLRQFSILFFLLFFAIQSFSQDISGEWVGGIYLKDKNGEYKIYFPVHFAISFDTLTGNMKGTNTTKSFDTVIVDCNIRGVYDQKKQQYTINETEAIKSSNNKTLAY